MDNIQAIAALAALAQTTRMDAFRKLVEHEPDGIAAGDLARLCEVPQNSSQRSVKAVRSFTAPISMPSGKSRYSYCRIAAAGTQKSVPR
jgi:hypothetical protein